jgi:hypothetical protein
LLLRADSGPQREHPEDVVIVVHGNAELLQVVAALRPAGRFAGGLDGGKQQGDEDRDNRDYHQQLNQRKTSPSRSHKQPFLAKEMTNQSEMSNTTT